jgi:hypothetical protein
MPEKETLVSVVSVRMLVSDLESLQAIAIINERTLTEEIVKAIQVYVAEHRDDPRFLAELESAAKRRKAFSDALASIAK